MRHSVKAVVAIGVIVVIAACSETGVSTSSLLKPDSATLDKTPDVTVCHAAGLAGTTNYVAITVSANGLNGHFEKNGTPKAGHELDFIQTANRPCSQKALKALLRICKLSSANEPGKIDLNRSFHFRRTDGADFDLKFNFCTEPREVEAREATLTEPHDPSAPAAFSYFATRVLVTNGTLLSSSGFNGSRPTTVQDASVRIRLTAGQLTTVTFFNRN